MPGDISAGSGNAGRGGWSWYSGSAAWYYRLIVEKLLGLRWSAEGFSLTPCLPADWPEFNLQFRHGDTSYSLTVEHPGQLRASEMEVIAANTEATDNFCAWSDDGQHHAITVRPRQKTAGQLSQEKTTPVAPDPN